MHLHIHQDCGMQPTGNSDDIAALEVGLLMPLRFIATRLPGTARSVFCL